MDFEFESFPEVEDVALASKFLHAYLLNAPDGAFKPSLGLCATSLTVDPALHSTLKAIHRKRDLDAFGHLRAYLKWNSWRFHPLFDEMNQAIRAIESAGKIDDVAVNEFVRSVWSPLKPISDAPMAEHIRNLQIPLGRFKEVPLVILHKLGSFQHDPLLRKRLDRIFSPSNHTLLVNTSGTGKTRLLFEGLCLHWGFYFTCTLDASLLGAGDFAHIVDNVSSDHNWKSLLPPISDSKHSSFVQDNIHVVYRACSEALLARLLVFNMYLKACSKVGFSHDQRRRWLEAQIFPLDLIPTFDPFGKIKKSISALHLSDSVLNEAISCTLEEIQCIWDMPAGEYFYIALDEANVASTKHRRSFLDEYGRYPILKEILRALRRRMGHLPVRFVVAGTMIPPEIFQSKVGEWDDFRWCSDTGSFDNPEEHRRYVSQFLPSELVSRTTGQSLLDRSWQWLRGRHRYTASFITVLLDNSFQSPHSLLGSYIENISNYTPHDNTEYTSGELVAYDKWYGSLGDSGLTAGWISVIEMHRSVINFLVTSQGCTDCSTNQRALVSEDYGYFIDPDCSKIALDEPLTIMYGAGWLKKTYQKKSRFQITNFDIFDTHHGTDPRASHFALFLALLFASMFDGFTQVSNAFTISGISTPFFEAKLVTFTRIGPRLEARDVHFTDHTPDRLVLLATTPEEALRWFKHEREEPFCVLQYSSSTSATLVFCLQFSDARTSWVFVRVPSTFQNKEDTDFARDIQDLHPTEIFRDQSEVASLLNQIPDLCLDAGPSGMLRISGSFWVEKATEESIPHELYPSGILNIEGLSGAAKSISEDMLMRRLSRIFSQRNEVTVAPSVSATEAPQERGKKRGRSTTIDDDAGTATSRTSRSKTKQHAKSTRSDHAASSGSSIQAKKARKGAGRSLRSRRIPNKISNVATGRASVSAPRSDRVEPTASSSSHTSPYNLRKR
ncbi:hypothetical protein EV359DRAFT_81906 [Lentinula novae-zelandiae]|nr:hypothetical protein EV359DRAFT_81906 [Lentinula novae-zelandiae]